VNDNQASLHNMQVRLASMEDQIENFVLIVGVNGWDLDSRFKALTDRIAALETRAIRRLEMVEEAVFSKPTPVAEAVTVSGPAFKQSIELLELIARTSDDELTVNRLGHAIRMLRGEESPVPF
jgi:hypothetical protein